jgi:hypothetical protein
MSRWTTISTVALATVWLGAGCLHEEAPLPPEPTRRDARDVARRDAPDVPPPDADRDPPSTTEEPYASPRVLVVENGSQSGHMGDIRGFSGAATNRVDEDYYDASYSFVRLDSTGDGWWVMSAINIWGDLAGPAFAPGTRRTFTTGVYDGDAAVSVTGCSGPEFGNYTFDGEAEDVEISVQSLPSGMRRMSYEVRFYDGAVTRGSFDYRIERQSGI